MNKLFEKAQQFGKSFMLPIAILPKSRSITWDWWSIE